MMMMTSLSIYSARPVQPSVVHAADAIPVRTSRACIVYKEIAELKTKIARKRKDLAVEDAAVKRMEGGLLVHQAKVDEIDIELVGLNKQLAEKEKILKRLAGGMRSAMGKMSNIKAMKLVRAFELTPDDAATKVQAAVRGKNARKGSGGKGEPKMSSKRTPSHAQATARLRGMPEHGLVPAPAPVAAPRPPPAPAVPIVKKISATEAVEPKFADDFNTALRHWQTHLQKVQPPRAKRPPKDLAAAAKSLVASSAPARVMPSGIHAALAASALKAATRADDGGM